MISISIDLVEYIAVLEKSAQLVCSIPLESIDQVAVNFWYKNTSEIPIYTIDMRKSLGFEKAHHILSENYKNRSYFNIFSSHPSLRIEPVQLEDEDEYRCRVDYRKVPTHNIFFNLAIIGKRT